MPARALLTLSTCRPSRTIEIDRTNPDCATAIRGYPSRSMRDDPFFSVVLATYGRGRHIAPTIESVLRQAFSRLELIVVGDGCSDETEAVVGSFNSDRVSWRNLAQNCGSQSFPNNEGIRRARGPWICYIGHDDIWSPDHLAEVY